MAGENFVRMSGTTEAQAERAHALLDDTVGQKGPERCEECEGAAYLVVAYVPRGKLRYQMHRKVLCTSCAFTAACGKIVALVSLEHGD